MNFDSMEIPNVIRFRFNTKIKTGNPLSDDDSESVSREASPCSESPRPVSVGSESPNENICTISNHMSSNNNNIKIANTTGSSTNMASAISKMSSNVMHSGSARALLMHKTGVSILHYVFSLFSSPSSPCLRSMS